MFAEFPQTQSIVTFGQPPALFVQHQFTMKKFRRCQTKRAIKQNLPRRAHEQIRTAHGFGNLHRRIIHDARELIRRNVVMPPNDKIAKIFSGGEFLFATISVRERNRFAVRNAKAPTEFTIDDFGFTILTASARINRLVTFRVRSGRGLLDVFARTSAGINEISGAQFFQRGAKKIHPLALIVRREFSANIRSFAPLKSKPAQVFEHRRNKFHFEARGVQIFVPQNQFAAVRPRAFLRDPECPRVAEMHITRRRRREASAIFFRMAHRGLQSAIRSDRAAAWTNFFAPWKCRAKCPARAAGRKNLWPSRAQFSF